jgi:hypothetical protein
MSVVHKGGRNVQQQQLLLPLPSLSSLAQSLDFLSMIELKASEKLAMM